MTANPVELPNASYQFTRKVSKFESKWFKIKGKDGSAFLWLTHVNDKTSVPYFFSNDQMLVLAARQIVLNEMFENHSAHITIHHQELGPVLGTRMNPFLLARSMPQSYFAHKELLADIPEGKVIHDGDGDCVFT
ncbi:MAG: hypothetical protein PF450_00540 [Bacteroidales bacterium]|nr:hypothetical protein [Bacteroidales bacterium]